MIAQHTNECLFDGTKRCSGNAIRHKAHSTPRLRSIPIGKKNLKQGMSITQNSILYWQRSVDRTISGMCVITAAVFNEQYIPKYSMVNQSNKIWHPTIEQRATKRLPHRLRWGAAILMLSSQIHFIDTHKYEMYMTLYAMVTKKTLWHTNKTRRLFNAITNRSMIIMYSHGIMILRAWI